MGEGRRRGRGREGRREGVTSVQLKKADQGNWAPRQGLAWGLVSNAELKYFGSTGSSLLFFFCFLLLLAIAANRQSCKVCGNGMEAWVTWLFKKHGAERSMGAGVQMKKVVAGGHMARSWQETTLPQEAWQAFVRVRPLGIGAKIFFGG